MTFNMLQNVRYISPVRHTMQNINILVPKKWQWLQLFKYRFKDVKYRRLKTKLFFLNERFLFYEILCFLSHIPDESFSSFIPLFRWKPKKEAHKEKRFCLIVYSSQEKLRVGNQNDYFWKQCFISEGNKQIKI